MTFAKVLKQIWIKSVGPDLDPNHLTLLAFLKEFLKKLTLKKVSRSDDNKIVKNYLANWIIFHDFGMGRNL